MLSARLNKLCKHTRSLRFRPRLIFLESVKINRGFRHSRLISLRKYLLSSPATMIEGKGPGQNSGLHGISRAGGRPRRAAEHLQTRSKRASLSTGKSRQLRIILTAYCRSRPGKSSNWQVKRPASSNLTTTRKPPRRPQFRSNLRHQSRKSVLPGQVVGKL